MPLGNVLTGTEQQYVAMKDEQGTWRILNTWHEDLKRLDADDDIPDDSTAVLVLSEGQFIALIKEAASQGVLQNANFGASGDSDEFEADLLDKDHEIQRLQEQVFKLQEEKAEALRSVNHSEEYELKEKAMGHILKLVSMQDMTNLSRE